MKILALIGSPRREGNTDRLVETDSGRQQNKGAHNRETIPL